MASPSATLTTGNRVPFTAMLVANTVSFLGNKLMVIAVPWFVLVTTGSAAKTGITGFVEAVAIVVSAFFGGAFVDRLGFKRASIIFDLGSGLAVAAIPLLYETIGIHYWQLLALVFLAAFFDTPGSTARTSLIPDLAELGGIPLERANSLAQGTQRFTLFLGPLLAGVLIAAMGTGNVLWFDAVSYVFSAALIGVAVIEPRLRAAASETRSGYLDELKEGLRFLGGSRLLSALVITSVAISLIDAPFFGVVIPVYAKDVYQSAFDLGLMMSTVGAGALAGILLYSIFGHRLPRRLVFLSGMACLSAPMWVVAIEPSVWVVSGVFAVGAFVWAPLNPLLMTVAMEQIPAGLRGRVFGLIFGLGLLTAPIGMLLAGFLIEWIGLVSTVLGMGMFYVIVLLVTAINPALRDLNPPTDTEERAPVAADEMLESVGVA